MELNRALLHESFKDDTVQEHVTDNPTLELILTLLDKLDGQTFYALTIFTNKDEYPHLFVLGGPDAFNFSLTKSLGAWKEYYDPNGDKLNWRAIGLGYHNHEVDGDQLCDKQTTIRAIKHFCKTEEWLTGIPFKERTSI